MIKFKVFAALVLLSFAGLFGLRYIPASDDIFSEEHSAKLDRLSNLSMEVVAREKFARRQSGRVKVGVFGNSHTWELQAVHLGLPPAEFFNFSIPDSSIRQTVRTLETFQKQDRLPKLVIVGVDNFEKTLVRNAVWPPPPQRWFAAAQDLAAGLWRENIPLSEVAWMGLRHGKFELEELKNVFDARLVYGQVSFRAPKWLPSPAARHGTYQPDGSYVVERVPRSKLASLVSTNAMLAGYFSRDMEKLAVATASVPRVILIEIPIEPESAKHFANNPSPPARISRSIFRSSCRSLKLECYEAPVMHKTNASDWRDAHHPSPFVLGTLIRNALDRKLDQIK